jgi:UDP-4-amino-4,6-dideoxy-N-acetyl-beta-L-altrosamine N-acetyltransferase
MISLRDIRPDDKEQVFQWRNLPEVAKYMYTDHVITPEEHNRWFSGLFNDPSRKYWIITLEQEDVGLVNIYDLDWHNKRCYWAFYLASSTVRGRGVGSFVEYSTLQYVFGELGLNKLCCEVLGFNEPVVNMHKSFGFVQEGIYREHIFKSSSFMDVVALAILSKEWEVKRPEIEEKLKAKGIL